MEPPALLLITCNRSQYLRWTLETLLSDPADFRLYCWDNASQDTTRDLIAGTRDERVIDKHFHLENANQREPWIWFVDRAKGDVVGKVDDDVLLPPKWTEQLAPVVRGDERSGMLGCWMFMEDEWKEPIAENVVDVGGAKVLRCISVAGHSFLVRRDLVRQYLSSDGYGLPVDRGKMTLDGYVSGYPLPPLFAHNMDDPRSPHCLYTKTSVSEASSALTARTLGFNSTEAYGRWIAADARDRLETPFSQQIKRLRFNRRQDIFARAQRKLMQMFVRKDSLRTRR